ncbi:MAG TPA: hypothetical protein VFR67_18195 [Pilimelia sp.]|nr:hypothetical protein [Pilimelia sp.]
MNKHATDSVSLGFGLAFLAVAVWWQLVASVDVDLPTFGWLIAGGLIVCGLLGVFASVRSPRRGTADGVLPGPEDHRQPAP